MRRSQLHSDSALVDLYPAQRVDPLPLSGLVLSWIKREQTIDPCRQECKGRSWSSQPAAVSNQPTLEQSASGHPPVVGKRISNLSLRAIGGYATQWEKESGTEAKQSRQCAAGMMEETQEGAISSQRAREMPCLLPLNP